jgi:hypothetical protein
MRKSASGHIENAMTTALLVRRNQPLGGGATMQNYAFHPTHPCRLTPLSALHGAARGRHPMALTAPHPFRIVKSKVVTP